MVVGVHPVALIVMLLLHFQVACTDRHESKVESLVAAEKSTTLPLSQGDPEARAFLGASVPSPDPH